MLFLFREHTKNLSRSPSARSKKFQDKAQAGGQKGRGSGGRNFCPPAFRAEGAAVRSEAFPPFGVKPNIKAKQFSTPFKKNLAGGR